MIRTLLGQLTPKQMAVVTALFMLTSLGAIGLALWYRRRNTRLASAKATLEAAWDALEADPYNPDLSVALAMADMRYDQLRFPA